MSSLKHHNFYFSKDLSIFKYDKNLNSVLNWLLSYGHKNVFV